VERLAARRIEHIYVDGRITIQRFLRAGLIQRLVITRVPVLIGAGIPLFRSLDADVRLRHVATRSFPSGLVQSSTCSPENSHLTIPAPGVFARGGGIQYIPPVGAKINRGALP
jgi:dihydrofolate reductase